MIPTISDAIAEVNELKQRANQIDKQLSVIAKQHPVARSLLAIPGIGVVTATAMIANPYDDGTSHVVLSPLEFVGQLAAR